MFATATSIAIWFPSLEHMGGIERVILEHIRIFSERGHKLVLVLEEVPTRFKSLITCPCVVMLKTQERKLQWEQIQQAHSPQVVIFHGADFPSVQSDLLDVRALGMKSVLNIHFSFPSPIIFNEASHIYALHEKIGSMVDGFATVSAMDAVCWQALGCNAWHVQNPFVHPEGKEHVQKDDPSTILWIGRFVEQKKPEVAIRVFSHIHSALPETRLQMLGCDYGAPALSHLIRQLGLQESVEILPSQQDTAPYYQNAKLCLITSITESFCLVLAEAKWHGLPVAMYEIPFLELADNSQGIVSAPFGEHERLAEKVLALLQDELLYANTSQAARASMVHFNDDAVYNSWMNLFSHLDFHEKQADKSTTQAEMITRSMVQAWNYHCSKNDWKIRFFDDTAKLLGGLPARLARFCVYSLYPALRNLKQKLR